MLPKSRTSVRQVNVGPQLLGTLAAVRRERYWTTVPLAEALLFATDSGKPLDSTNVRQRWWQVAIERAPAAAEDAARARHTFASQLLAQGEPSPTSVSSPGAPARRSPSTSTAT